MGIETLKCLLANVVSDRMLGKSYGAATDAEHTEAKKLLRELRSWERRADALFSDAGARMIREERQQANEREAAKQRAAFAKATS